MKMKNLFAVVLFFLIATSTTSLSALPTSWSYTVTFNTHVILVQQSVPITINSTQIVPGDYIGVFYPNASGGLNCGGYMEYTAALGSLSAWPEDLGNDGFPTGQDFIWKIWDASANIEYLAYPTYDQTGVFTNAGQFAQNGMSGLIGLQAITASVPWSYFITSTNHTILIPEDITVLMDEGPFGVGDYIGVFYYDSTNLVCGGYCPWYGSTASISAWGDDTQTPNKDGFIAGDEFIWKIWDASANQQYFASAVYMPAMLSQGFFEVNGMSGLDSLIINTPWSVTVTSTNHTILAPSYSDFSINNMPLGYGDLMGVFYDSLGTLKCGGFTVWDGLTTSITAWGEDLGYDGFLVGDEFIWKIYDISEGIEYFATPTYMGLPMTNQGFFAINGMSGLVSLHAELTLVPWEFTITSTNHQILLPDFASYLIDGLPIESGDYIGVFYDSLGSLVCAGYQKWEGISTSIAAWGAETGNDGFVSGEAFKWKIWDASEDTVYDAQATYMQPPAMPHTGFYEANGMSGLLSLESYFIQVPWSFINTGTNHTVLLPATADITIDTSSIEIGDYLGVFFDSLGTLVCAGYAEWTGITSAVTAWGADAGLDGFAMGEAFKWKIWDASADTVYDAFATYEPVMPNLGNYATNGMSALLTLGTDLPFSSQIINLLQGWGIYSTYIDPFESLLDSVFADVLLNLQIVKDGNGNIFWPQYNLNIIGNMVVGNGYQVKMYVADVLEIIGDAVVPEQSPITLNANWGIYAYLRQSPAPITVMLSTLTSYIEIVKNGAGSIYWPSYGLDMIGNMLPGDGYQMKLNSVQTLLYPPNTVAASKTLSHNNSPFHFGVAQNTGSNMSLAIPSEAWPNGFSPQNNGEIAIYSNSGQLVGSARFTGQNIALSIWGNDELSQECDGLLPGESFEIRYWSPNKEEKAIRIVEWEKGDGLYATNQISVAKMVLVEETFRLGQNYPNPYMTSTQIEVYLPEATSASLKIFNEFGQLEMVYPLIDLKIGANIISIPVDKLTSGHYFYRFESDGYTETKAMQIVR
ncbi:MAG: T9SS type A sorting domain-containing protein [Bacteroidales bacterium]|nr:T9SS type A sorting domain-containing protein [Bacteroidales bacterium]MCF8457597.1 T9SS type A sorting domain-containing protein [Bacteroidales bacterium]